MTTFDKVYAAVRLIPRGSVATYGQIAAAIGNIRPPYSPAPLSRLNKPIGSNPVPAESITDSRYHV